MSYLKNDLKLLGWNTHMCLGQVQNRARRTLVNKIPHCCKEMLQIATHKPFRSLNSELPLANSQKICPALYTWLPNSWHIIRPIHQGDSQIWRTDKAERFFTNSTARCCHSSTDMQHTRSKNYINAVHMMETQVAQLPLEVFIEHGLEFEFNVLKVPNDHQISQTTQGMKYFWK